MNWRAAVVRRPLRRSARNSGHFQGISLAHRVRLVLCLIHPFILLFSKLIMSVNRFSKEAKLAKHIVPPQVLDIRPFLENLESQLPSEYTLAAQIVHIGRSKNSGLFVFLKF